MKKQNIIRNSAICTLLFLTVCLAVQICPAQDNSAAANELLSLLNQHDDALSQKNLDALMMLYAEGKNTVVMGTGPGEKFEGKESIRSAYEEISKDYDTGSLSHTCSWKTGGINGDMAWLAAMCQMSDTAKKKKRQYELNVSVVFEKMNGKWLIRSMHYSNVVSGKKRS